MRGRFADKAFSRAAIVVATAIAALAAPAAEDRAPAAGRFLVADEAMGDPRFARTVILLVDYGPRGALGLIVNRSTKLTLGHVFPDRELSVPERDVLWFGGPVAQNTASLLVESDAVPPSARRVLSTVHFATSGELLDALLTGERKARFRVYSGYSGWAPSQLDAELARGDWRVTTARVDQVFTADGERLWRELVGADGTWVEAPRARPRALSAWPGYAPSRRARISHQPSAAAPQWRDLTGFPSVGKANDLAPLRRLATNAGEKSGLERRHRESAAPRAGDSAAGLEQGSIADAAASWLSLRALPAATASDAPMPGRAR